MTGISSIYDSFFVQVKRKEGVLSKIKLQPFFVDAVTQIKRCSNDVPCFKESFCLILHLGEVLAGF